MPKALSSTASSIAATLWCRQNATNWSIIEQDSTLHDDLLTGGDAGQDDRGGALAQAQVDDTALEGPRCRRHEHTGAVVVHEQRRGGHDDLGVGGPKQRHGG